MATSHNRSISLLGEAVNHKKICAMTIIFVAGCHRPGQCADCSPWPSAYDSPPPAQQALTTVPPAAAPVSIPGRRYLPLTQEQVSRGVVSCYYDDSSTLPATQAMPTSYAVPAAFPSPLPALPAVSAMPALSGGAFNSCPTCYSTPSYQAGYSTSICTSGGCSSCGR